MKLNVNAFANASAVLTGIVYVVCAVLVVLLPNFFRAVATSWFHGMDLGAIWTGAPRGNFFLGLVTAMGGTWITGWLFAWLYNKLIK